MYRFLNEIILAVRMKILPYFFSLLKTVPLFLLFAQKKEAKKRAANSLPDCVTQAGKGKFLIASFPLRIGIWESHSPRDYLQIMLLVIRRHWGARFFACEDSFDIIIS